MIRVYLLAITLAGSRLRCSLVLLYCVEHALSAYSTQYNKLFARQSRANSQREKAKTLRIRHALNKRQEREDTAAKYHLKGSDYPL